MTLVGYNCTKELIMKVVDKRHLVYHVLVALYFVWLIVLGGLLAMAFLNYSNYGSYQLTRAIKLWILFNLTMGTLLLAVIRLFRKAGHLSRIIFYSYFIMVILTIGVSIAFDIF